MTEALHTEPYCKLMSLKAEIIRLKTELEDRELVIAKWYRIVERREKQIIELREAVAWHFECNELYEHDRAGVFVHGDGYLELLVIAMHAEQQLREMIK